MTNNYNHPRRVILEETRENGYFLVEEIDEDGVNVRILTVDLVNGKIIYYDRSDSDTVTCEIYDLNNKMLAKKTFIRTTGDEVYAN